MPNYSSTTLSAAISGLRAQQAVIATTGNNISNVNTPGYSRRVVELSSRSSGDSSGGINLGGGVSVEQVRRINDSILENVLREAGADQSSAGVTEDFLTRLEPLFSLNGTQDTIGSTFTEFFTAANDLSANPSSVELRSNFVAKTQNLVSAIKLAYNTVAGLQTEADQRVANDVTVVNSLTSQIAALNGTIAQTEAGGATANDDRDRRDQLLQQLSAKLSYKTVEQSDGSLIVYLDNGFPLVAGSSSRNLSVDTTPSFAGSTLPPSLGGGVLSYIVYDYGASGSAQIDLTGTIAGGSGEMAGLLGMRGIAAASNTSAFQATGTLVQVASRIEALTRSLLTNVNLTYLGPDRDTVTVGYQPSSGYQVNGVNFTPTTYGLFDFTFGGSKDANANGRPDDIGAHTGIDNYSSILLGRITDPNTVAAARDATPSAGSPTFPVGDGRNMVALAALQTTKQSAIATITVGSYTMSNTFDETYNEAVTYVGSAKATAKLNSTVSQDRYNTAASKRDEVSGVSLDEEFTKLITSQKAFQASARMIKTASELLDEITRLI